MPSPKWLPEASTLQSLPGRKTQSIHLLRAILRECTYLPDAAARAYMKNHVLSRFNAYQPKGSHSAKYIRPALQPRFTQLHATARKGLAHLRRANAGYTGPLSKVLYMSYGRQGTRRHELLAPLKKDASFEGGKPDIITQELLKLKVPDEVKVKLPRLSAPLQALLESQRRASPPNMTRPKVRRVHFEIPEKNIWQRPMPVKRTVNLVKEWYGSMLYKVLPPLPEAEWERLGKLACGVRRWEGPVKRRPIGGRGKEDGGAPKDGGLSIELQQEIGLVKRKPRYIEPPGNPHELTPRYMRRLWQAVFRMCPAMAWETERQAFNIRWGSRDAERNFVKHRKPQNAGLLRFFED